MSAIEDQAFSYHERKNGTRPVLFQILGFPFFSCSNSVCVGANREGNLSSNGDFKLKAEPSSMTLTLNKPQNRADSQARSFFCFLVSVGHCQDISPTVNSRESTGAAFMAPSSNREGDAIEEASRSATI